MSAPARKSALLLLVLWTVSSLISPAVAGEKEQKAQTRDLVETLGDGVSAKEPGFKIRGRRKRTKDDISNFLGWRSGEDFVSMTFYELASPQEAAERLQATLKAPVSVISETLKLDGLGDEAYIKGDGAYSKPGYTSLFFRKRNVVLTLSASSPELAKRFADHLVREISPR